ncbi:protein-glutamate O-methyltransferase CheR [Halioxenophilus sp. WMMB6]|uniref:CheR family methyltransferase n=1 Tax=Halioxenophilus sp. WMMB6 TaxID=3073815 RepID=UPI00295E5317|nr:protein-glutamate O-methyltransferase CheR [Halioxenophilus sp. WMMB6]
MDKRDFFNWTSKNQFADPNREEFHKFRDYLESVSGIHLPDNKDYLIVTRLKKILQNQGLDSITSLLSEVQRAGRRELREQVINAMTTNETFWFRDNYPFHYFQQRLLPDLFRSRAGKIRVWCAACSSGQEPYSLAMLADEMTSVGGQFAGRQVEFIATDISTAMLERCKEGVYDKLEITRGMRPERMQKHFHQVSENLWQVEANIRQKVNFRQLNLTDAFIGLGKFDVIFCRNVLIYFNSELKTNILGRLHEQLVTNGTLFLGASEGLGASGNLFEMIQCEPGIAYRALAKTP